MCIAKNTNPLLKYMCSAYLNPWSPSTSRVSSFFILFSSLYSETVLHEGSRVLQLIVRMWMDKGSNQERKGAALSGPLRCCLMAACILTSTSPFGTWHDSVEATQSGRCGGGLREAWTLLVGGFSSQYSGHRSSGMAYLLHLHDAFFVLTPLRLKNSCATSLSLRFLPCLRSTNLSLSGLFSKGNEIVNEFF